ncbi:TetR/AcrR family transcriptional regulator [Brachybacterium sp. FME24]|uniref:TetR/AcrR family transcriptional regulator n=1 Tax=Brachybacterium sp. FME24 TaxID=2742605 RepID=UPI0018677963|nr:TetR/AcrR family transcriptional regulator [Brachybacterium sp. FME24]
MTRQEDLDGALRPPELTPGARRILEVASELFYRHGIHAVGVDAIAATSGITKRTLYDRFGSKDRLVAAYLQARHQLWWNRMEHRVSTASQSPVLALFDSYIEDSESTERGCAFLNAAAELPDDHPGYRVIQAHKRAVLDRLVELLDSDPSEFRDAGSTAREVYLLMEGAVAHRGIDGDDRLFRSAREMTERLLRERRTSATTDS